MMSIGHGGAGAPSTLVGGAALGGVGAKRDRDHVQKIRILNSILNKQDVDIKNSHILMYPMSIAGKNQDAKNEVPPYHMTVKWFGNDPSHQITDVQKQVEKYHHTPPENIEITPHHFETARGRVHVLLLHGLHPDVHKMHHELTGSESATTPKYPYIPHVTVDKELWDKVKNEGLKAKDLNIKFGNLEYRVGHDVAHRFEPPKPAMTYLKKIGESLNLLKSFMEVK